jgi:hypothetical protein
VLIQDTYAVARAKAHHQNLFEEIAIRNSQVRLITKTLSYNFYLSKTVVAKAITFPSSFSLIGTDDARMTFVVISVYFLLPAH